MRRSAMLRRWLAWFGLAGLMQNVPIGHAFAAPQDMVVMVDARHGRGAGADFGAGLVVSQTSERTVIVTALHVVANESGDLATDIKVEFSARRGRYYAASVSPYYTDRRLDLAVLLVEHDRGGMPPQVLEGGDRRILSPTPPEKLAGAQVSLIGAMNRQRWARGPQGDSVVGGTPQQLQVRSVEAMAGASGGGIFDSLARLIGMASRIDSGSGHLVVVPIEAALARVRRWGIEVSLEPASAASTDDGLAAQLRDGLSLELTYNEPDPPAAGARWPDVESNGFRHRLQAKLSPALKELAPVVRLEFTNNLNVAPIELKGPDYVWEKRQVPVVFDVQATLVLPDRRRLGPVPKVLDFESQPLAAAKRLGIPAEAVARSRAMFDFQQRESRAAAERTADAQQDFTTTHAANIEAGMRDNYSKAFSGWNLRCEKRDERWNCRPNGHVPRHPYGAKLSNVVHALKIGSSERDLSVSFPIDPAVDLAQVFHKEAAALLDDGASRLFVWMRLSTGEALGPKELCAVRSKRKGASTVCD